MARPVTDPTWATTGTRVAPTAGKQLIGWLFGDVVPFGTLNFLQGVVGDWIAYFRDKIGATSYTYDAPVSFRRFWAPMGAPAATGVWQLDRLGTATGAVSIYGGGVLTPGTDFEAWLPIDFENNDSLVAQITTIDTIAIEGRRDVGATLTVSLMRWKIDGTGGLDVVITITPTADGVMAAYSANLPANYLVDANYLYAWAIVATTTAADISAVSSLQMYTTRDRVE